MANTVLIVEDQRLQAETVRDRLKEAGYEPLQIIDNWSDARAFLRRHSPDIATLDLRIRIDKDGKPQNLTIRDISRLCSASPRTCVVAWTESDSRETVESALRGGVRGYLTKSASLEEVRTCFASVLRGSRYLEASLACVTVPEIMACSVAAGPFSQLTDLQRSIVRDICEGLTPSEIAERRSISEATVSRYRGRIRSAVGVKNDVQLYLSAERHGILHE